MVLTGHIQADDEPSFAFRLSGRVVERPVNVGARVEAGQVLAKLDPENEQSALCSAEAALTAAQGQLNYARGDFERQRHLLANGHTHRARFDQAQKVLQNAQSPADNAEAQLEIARNRVRWTTLTADAQGTATAIGAEPGEVVQAGQMLEVVVLLLALLAVWSLAPDRLWGGLPGPHYRSDPNGILTFVAQLLVPIGILIGIHIFWIGSSAPGGEFQGATILAAMWILTTPSGLMDAPALKRRGLRLLLIIGPAVFVAIGLAGIAMAGTFLAYPMNRVKLLILIIKVRVTLSIAAMLTLLVAGPPERSSDR